jgi:hypothetical protein
MSESGSLQAAPDRTMSETMRLNPKMQWKPQEVRDARNVDHPPKKAAGIQKN